MEIDTPVGTMLAEGAVDLTSPPACSNVSERKRHSCENGSPTETATVDLSPGFDIPKSHLTDSSENNLPVYDITADQYVDLKEAHAQSLLPNDILFPWLHGVDGQSHRQNLFFGIRRCHVPQYRGLMLVHADFEQPRCNRLVQSVLPSEFLTPDDEFKTLGSQSQTINLRNFQIQVCRYASISDIVVYGSNAKAMALKISIAQTKLKQARLERLAQIKRSAGARAVLNATPLDYRVFIITDSFGVFEKSHPDMIGFNAFGEPVHHLDFWEREGEEMRTMSRASEVTDNVWFGNTQDAPAAIPSSTALDHDTVMDTDAYSPHRFSICIEAHDLADMPSTSTLDLANKALNTLPADQLPPETIHLDTIATSSQMNTGELHELSTRLLPLLEFMDHQTSRGRRILVHCSDGYSETSLLALSWLMYKLDISLPEAYLYLQERRSFFVNADDVATLQHISNALQRACSSRSADHKRKRPAVQPGQKEADEAMHEREDSTPRRQRTLYDDSYINAISNSHSDDPRTGASAMGEERMVCSLPPPSDVYGSKAFPWFYSSRFEGSFPSRILPYLYLGNLNHATNADMLKALQITHIVSVGENAGLSPDEFNLLFLDNLYDDGIDSVRTRYDETMRFIDDAHRAGTRCLIHCRVGVSRSAAVTICYLMHHLNFDLVRAYLFVRARRLNVIIQPNLKFMYELMQLEQHLHGKTYVTWPILSREIHQLNESCHED